MPTQLFVSILLLAQSCRETPPIQVRIGGDLRSALSCQIVGGLRDMTAVLQIGSADECPLDNVFDDKAISGRCPGVPAGEIENLWVTYKKIGEPLAVLVSYIDLTNIPESTDEVVWLVSTDRTQSVIIFDQASWEALPTTSEASQSPLEQSKAAARNSLHMDFDHDDDGCPNLAELCRGTLGSDEKTGC